MKKTYSKAEDRFRDFIKEVKPNIQVTKKGFPDFALIKGGEIVGFVEVKRTAASDELREEQELFRKFFRKHNIPYQVWSPNMALNSWEKASKRFRQIWAYGGEIWDKI